MSLLPQLKLLSHSSTIMGSKHFFVLKCSLKGRSFSLKNRFFHSDGKLVFYSPVRELSSPVYYSASGYSHTSHAAQPFSGAVSSLNLETLEKQSVDPNPLMTTRQKLKEFEIDGNACLPGQYYASICPKCKGVDSFEKSLSVYITEDGGAAMWTCFGDKCRWRGNTRSFADVNSSYSRSSKVTKTSQPIREITEQSLNLEPLCNELIAYFADRMISVETLQRNAVMQKRTGDQIAIAFPYRRNGQLVNCKYRTITTKRFWQEARTEKILYGLDDIVDANEIIIVEGEIDKLSMEEAGFMNCVSVPDGAPLKFSNKTCPSEEEDTRYRYIWNCKAYTDKVSRIILATDGDPSGQVLAEELAQRLGRERCWRVKWPEKNDTLCFKDANEVLMYLGRDALREVIQNAELCSPDLSLPTGLGR